MSSSPQPPAVCVIAVDGPAGAGKSTVSREVARELGFLYIDTGAMYRALTLKALMEKVDFRDSDGLVRLARNTKIDLKNSPEGETQVFLDGQDVSQEIRRPKVTRFVSDLAKIPGVRKEMLVLQRRFGEHYSCVLDGRDIATVVFPNADKKFFLDANFKVRVKRRYEELKACGQEIALDEVSADLKNRDTIDSTRECAPLKQAKDAIYIDTTGMTIKEVADRILQHIRGL